MLHLMPVHKKIKLDHRSPPRVVCLISKLQFGHRCYSRGPYSTVLHSSIDYDIDSMRLYVT